MVTVLRTGRQVWNGSFSDFGGSNRDVRFPPVSDSWADIAGGPFRAKLGRRGKPPSTACLLRADISGRTPLVRFMP